VVALEIFLQYYSVVTHDHQALHFSIVAVGDILHQPFQGLAVQAFLFRQRVIGLVLTVQCIRCTRRG
jgi:hypothetical protein